VNDPSQADTLAQRMDASEVSAEGDERIWRVRSQHSRQDELLTGSRRVRFTAQSSSHIVKTGMPLACDSHLRCEVAAKVSQT